MDGQFTPDMSGEGLSYLTMDEVNLWLIFKSCYDCVLDGSRDVLKRGPKCFTSVRWIGIECVEFLKCTSELVAVGLWFIRLK